MLTKTSHSPLFFFASQVSGDKVKLKCRSWTDVYLWEICRPFDGILVSLAYIKGKKRKEVLERGVHKTFRIPKGILVMGDCGAWQYKHLDEVPYSPEEVVEFYEKGSYDFGITLDQLVLKSKLTWREKGITKSRVFTRKEQYDRMLFSLKSAKIMREISSSPERLFASVQGITSDDYVWMTKKYLDVGFTNLALGGLAKTHTSQLKTILNSVFNEVHKYNLENEVKLHVLGVGRPSMWKFFKENGIFSFDTSRYHRIAWIKGEYVFWNGFELESYDVRPYDYRNFNSNPPIPNCDCPVCSSVGKDEDGVVWTRRFGTNQRNMSRGFHNLWHFYQYYQSEMKPTLVLIACSQRKGKTKTQAKNMYQGRLFKLSKLFAETNGYEYKILSAKYGLLEPTDLIEPYEQTIRTKQDIQKLQRIIPPKLNLTKYGRIIVLGGKKYREILKPKWDERFVFIESKGYGDLCKQIAQKIPNSNETLIPYVEVSVGEEKHSE